MVKDIPQLQEPEQDREESEGEPETEYYGDSQSKGGYVFYRFAVAVSIIGIFCGARRVRLIPSFLLILTLYLCPVKGL